MTNTELKMIWKYFHLTLADAEEEVDISVVGLVDGFSPVKSTLAQKVHFFPWLLVGLRFFASLKTFAKKCTVQ